MARHLVVDTNVLVRFLTGEPPALAERARQLVEDAESGAIVLEILPVIVAETVYTLESFYEMDRRAVSSKISLLLKSRGFHATEEYRVLDALRRHSEQNVDFADAYLAAAAKELGFPAASFDRDLDRFDDVHRVEPGGVEE